MASEAGTRQIVIGVGTSMTSALISAFIVFFLLVMRKRLRDKQLLLRNMQRMRSAIPLPRSRSHSAQSALSASGYSAGFRGASAPDDIQDRRQIRKVTAYNDRSFSQAHDGAGVSAIMDPWDHVLPGRGKPLHHVHDPFHGRSRGQDRTVHQDTLSSAPPSEGQPAVSAFRASKFPVTPTTFYTYDGRIASTFNSYHDDSAASPRQYEPHHSGGRDTSNQGHSSRQGQGHAKKGRDGRTYYYGRQLSNESLDSGLREQGASASYDNLQNRQLGASASNDNLHSRRLGASASSGNLYTPKKQYYRKNERRPDEDSSFPWHSTPIRQSAREPRQRNPSLPRTNTTLRRNSFDSTPSPKESFSWAGVEPHWRSDLSEMSSASPKRRSGSYDELESRHHRRRYDSAGDVNDLAVFNWSPSVGPVISLDHNPSSTYDGDVNLEAKVESNHSESSRSSELDHDSALYSMDDLPRFTKSTAKLDLSNEEGGADNEALQLEEMYY